MFERFTERGREELERREQARQLVAEIKKLAPQQEYYYEVEYKSASLARILEDHDHFRRSKKPLWFFQNALQFSREDILEVGISDSHVSVSKDRNKIELPFEEKTLKSLIPEAVFDSTHWKLIKQKDLNELRHWRYLLVPLLEAVCKDLKGNRQIWSETLKAKKELYYGDLLRQSDSNTPVVVDQVLEALKAGFNNETFSVFGLPLEKDPTKVRVELLTTLPIDSQTTEKIIGGIASEGYISCNLQFSSTAGHQTEVAEFLAHFQAGDPENNSEIEISLRHIKEFHPSDTTEGNFKFFLEGDRDKNFKAEETGNFFHGTLLLRHPDNPLEKEY
jgi:hypothetical protein